MKRTLTFALATAAYWLLAVSATVQAQTIYKYVGPDGRIVFSDKPPSQGENAVERSHDGRYGDTSASESELPYILRQVVTRYPVILYSSENCEPCASGHALLTTRGIPFSERTVKTVNDSEAFQRLSGTDSLPVLTVGNQVIKGYSDAQWNQYLDAAGYPASSQLPRNYRNPPPAPLTAPAKPAAPPAAGNGEPPSAEELAPPPPPNPGGFIF